MTALPQVPSEVESATSCHKWVWDLKEKMATQSSSIALARGQVDGSIEASWDCSEVSSGHSSQMDEVAFYINAQSIQLILRY